MPARLEKPAITKVSKSPIIVSVDKGNIKC